MNGTTMKSSEEYRERQSARDRQRNENTMSVVRIENGFLVSKGGGGGFNPTYCATFEEVVRRLGTFFHVKPEDLDFANRTSQSSATQ